MSKKQYGAMSVLVIVAGLVGGVVSSQLFMGELVFAQKTPQPAEVIRAEKFELVDKDGKRRALLGPGVDGEPVLGLYDENGNLRIGLSLRPDGGPNLLLWDGDSQIPRAGLALLPDGNPSLEFSDKDGNLRAVGGLGADGEPVLGLYDEDGNLHTVLGTETDEESAL